MIRANVYKIWEKIYCCNYTAKFYAVTFRGAGSGWQRDNCPLPLIFLKRGDKGGRLCCLKLVLQINFFSYALQLTYITIKSNNICKITKTTVTHSTVIKAR